MSPSLPARKRSGFSTNRSKLWSISQRIGAPIERVGLHEIVQAALDARRIGSAPPAGFAREERQRIVDPQIEVVLTKRPSQECGERTQPLSDHEEAALGGLDVLAREHGGRPGEQSPKRL